MIDWERAFATVPREHFIPDEIYERTEGNQHITIRRHREPERWRELVESDVPVITQLNDGRETDGSLVSSSSSMPSVMKSMLYALEAEAGDTVLEIGTGTGWNAALLSTACTVTTVEVDTILAEQARKRLRAYDVAVIAGDGTHGYPGNAPYDRILSTASVTNAVPYEWIEQTAPGGRIVVPWGTDFLATPLLRMTAHGDGTASGTFDGQADFMQLRDRRIPREIPERENDPYTESTTDLHPYYAVGDLDGSAFAVSLFLSDVQYNALDVNDEQKYELLLWDRARSSWATVGIGEPGAHPVRRHGPRDIWKEIEAAVEFWAAHGKPRYTRFGVMVTPERQWVYLDDPANEVNTLR
ncbi:methyltransferase domain-containing protein [Amycolatopsis samaneae]|uniref:Protein-L-isoaspartate O-methyltransferase n=1 Tax=Amycolatopsis samaneae TaxID=664691 RepID=A0ABW5GS64_9PSEU